MTTIQYITMFIGFSLWFWAGYQIGYSKGKKPLFNKDRHTIS